MIGNVVVIGVGGIGTHLINVLARYMSYDTNWGQLILVDGDVFEDRNRERQLFRAIGNKAFVVADEVRQNFDNLEVRAVCEYVNELNVAEIINTKDIVFLCVDNHVTRKIVSDHCQTLDNILLISGGNELTDGNVLIYWREKSINKTNPIATDEYHPEIEYPEDNHPEDIGCDEMVEHEPQLVFMNNAIASKMLEVFYSWSYNRNFAIDEICIDMLTCSSRVIRRKLV